MAFKKGNIHLVKFDPVKGVEAGKIRPAVIFQSQDLLDIEYKTIIVIPLTTNLKGEFPLRVRIKSRDKLQKDSDIMVDQIRAVDRSRIYPEIITTLTEREIKLVEEAISYVMDIKMIS